jgi:hypothetical protein
VLANDRLRSVGWEPRHTNDEALLDGLASLPPRSSRAPALVLGLVVGALVAARRAARRRTRGPSS